MSTLTGGTKATTTLTALQFPGPTGVAMSDADVATIAAAIINDKSPSLSWPGAFSKMGLLYIPNRGVLQVLPDDFVMVTPGGWPILVSSMSCALTLTANGTPVSGSTAMTMGSNVIPLGWKIGGSISGTNIATGATISNISSDGLTITMSLAATGSPGSETITYGSFTHS